MRKIVFPALLLIAAADEVHAWRVVNVSDGDTVTAIDEGNTQHRIRLQGIDAPELGQPFGQASKRALSDLVFGKTVTLHTTGTDRYKRTLAHVTVDDIEVEAQMIATGHAWHYILMTTRAALEAAERNARADRRGLCADAKPVAPWEWRKGERWR